MNCGWSDIKWRLAKYTPDSNCPTLATFVTNPFLCISLYMAYHLFTKLSSNQCVMYFSLFDEVPEARPLFDRVHGDNVRSKEFRAHSMRVIGGKAYTQYARSDARSSARPGCSLHSFSTIDAQWEGMGDVGSERYTTPRSYYLLSLCKISSI